MRTRHGFTPKNFQRNFKGFTPKNFQRNFKGFTPKNFQRNFRGFTLIELMIVVVILAILAAAVVPRLAGRTQQARINTAKMDISGNISVALDLYELDNGRYPNTEEGLSALLTKPGSAKNWNGPYLKKKALDPWGTEYKYASPGTHNNDYDLYSLGPDGSDGTSDDITNWETTTESTST